eukprot:2633255-Amphidinium_carterae.1
MMLTQAKIFSKLLLNQLHGHLTQLQPRGPVLDAASSFGDHTQFAVGTPAGKDMEERKERLLEYPNRHLHCSTSASPPRCRMRSEVEKAQGALQQQGAHVTRLSDDARWALAAERDADVVRKVQVED